LDRLRAVECAKDMIDQIGGRKSVNSIGDSTPINGNNPQVGISIIQKENAPRLRRGM